MSKTTLICLLVLTMFTASCGTADPTVASSQTSPASPSAPQSSASSTSLVLPNTAYSQNIRFEQFSLEEGLSQSVANVVLQDRMGFLWVGTEDGLNRYDGYSFKVYKPDADDPFSLSDRWITSLAEDSEGLLWVGTRLGGLNRYDSVTGRFTHFVANEMDPASLGLNKILSLLLDETGMWVGTEDGLDFYDYESGVFTHYRATKNNTNSLSSNSITALFKDASGMLWVGTSNAG